MKLLIRTCKGLPPLLFFSLAVLFGLSLGHPNHVDHSDAEIERMDIDALVHVEHDLRSQNRITDKHIASLNGRLSNLKIKQNLLEETERNVSHARNWETKQKRSRQKELERAKAELEAKKEQANVLLSHTQKLRDDIHLLNESLRILNLNKEGLEDQLMRPSLETILTHKAARMGSLPQHILNKTFQYIVPEVEYGLHEFETAREKLPHDSAVITVFISLCVYILALTVLYITFTLLRNLHNLFTMTRILFTTDMAFAFTWTISCLFFMILSDDPFELMAQRHEGLTVIVQVVLIGALISNVILRCIPISLQCRKAQLIELVCVVFLVQHYYQAVWRPCLLDEKLLTSFGTYCLYFFISAGLAVYRARSFGPEMEEMHGLGVRGSLKVFRKGSWLRMKMERTLKYCENLLSSPTKQEYAGIQIEPQYYRRTRHQEFSRGKQRFESGRTALRPDRKPMEYKQ